MPSNAPPSAPAVKRYVDSHADIQPARYVAPYGTDGLALMELPGSGVRFVAGSPPGRTFRPQTLLPVGSKLGGSTGRVVLQTPGADSRGASAVQASRAAVVIPTGPPMLVRIEPPTFWSGEADQPGFVRGLNFRPHLALVATKHDAETGVDVVDTRFTFHDAVIVDAGKQIDFLLDVDESAPPGLMFDVAIVNLAL